MFCNLTKITQLIHHQPSTQSMVVHGTPKPMMSITNLSPPAKFGEEVVF